MSEIQEVYSAVCQARSLAERLNDGAYGSLSVYQTGWLSKKDQQGQVPTVWYEGLIYRQLEWAGLTGKITPLLLKNSKSEIIISRINDAASLGEYAELFFQGGMSLPLWKNLCIRVGEVIKLFHSKGFVHCDLHGGNIVIEMREGTWYPFLIDFGLSAHDNLEYPYEIEWSRMEPESDVETIAMSLLSLDPRESTDLWKGLAALEKSAAS